MTPRAILRLLAALVLPVALAACGAVDRAAPLADVQRAAYRHNAPASLTLYTAISNNTGAGGHSGLLINGSQRVMFDPAGTWWNRLPGVTEAKVFDDSPDNNKGLLDAPIGG